MTTCLLVVVMSAFSQKTNSHSLGRRKCRRSHGPEAAVLTRGAPWKGAFVAPFTVSYDPYDCALLNRSPIHGALLHSPRDSSPGHSPTACSGLRMTTCLLVVVMSAFSQKSNSHCQNALDRGGSIPLCQLRMPLQLLREQLVCVYDPARLYSCRPSTIRPYLSTNPCACSSEPAWA